MCEAAKYNFCRGIILDRVVENTDINITLCDLHSNVCSYRMNAGSDIETKNKDKTKDKDKTKNNILKKCIMTDLYCFWYCINHDNGLMIKTNNFNSVPDWCKMCGLGSSSSSSSSGSSINSCDETAWELKGIINYDGSHIIELTDIVTEYEHDFDFESYLEGYFENDDKNYFKEFDIYEPIYDWFAYKLKR